jgi:hypothetical protein
MTKNDVILAVIMATVAFVIGVAFNKLNPDFLRYEVALNAVTGKPCYIKDWATGEKLPVSKELLDKVDGSFYCDPSLCE